MKSRKAAAVLLVPVTTMFTGLANAALATGVGLPVAAHTSPTFPATNQPFRLAQASASSTDNAVSSPPNFVKLPTGLLKPAIIFPESTFRRTIRRDRTHVCDALQQEGWVSNAWQTGTGRQQQWSCGAEKSLTENSDPDNPSGSLFVGARGKGSDTVSSVRLKINFLTGEISPFVLEQAVMTTERLLAILGWGRDSELVQNVRELKAFKIEGNGYRISLSRERSDVPRYNFQIISEAPDIYQGAGGLTGDRELLEAPNLAPID